MLSSPCDKTKCPENTENIKKNPDNETFKVKPDLRLSGGYGLAFEALVYTVSDVLGRIVRLLGSQHS